MAFLTDQFRATFDKEKLGEEAVYTPSYSTGINLFDYRNGRMEGSELKVGLDGGRIVTIIGKSGVGKTTMAVQMATKIVEPYENGQVIHLDYERATNPARIKQLTGWSDKLIEEKYIIRSRSIYSETLYSMVKASAKVKLENFEQIKVATKEVDKNGKTIYVLPPTVILVDSWTTVVPKNISEEEELSGSMAASAIAKTNNAIIKRITGPLDEGNIILMIINHITQKIEIGPVKTQAQLNYLKQDESIPGGTSAIYLANTLLKLQASSKLEEDKDFGIKGFKIFGELIKSRSNEAGNKFELIYHQREGYHNTLTNFNLLKGLGYLKGNGRAYYFEDAPDIKFTQKNFLEKYKTDETLKLVFDALVKSELAKYLSSNTASDELDVDGSMKEIELELVEHIAGDIWLANDGHQYHYDEKEETITPVEK